MLGEDVEDQRGAVDDLDLDGLLQRVELSGGQLAVADDGVGAGGHDDVAQFLGLARADVGRRVGLVAPLHHALEHLGARRLGERGQLGHAGVGVGGGAVGPDADEHDAFEPQLAVFDLGDVGEFGRETGHPAQRRAVFEGEFARAGDVGCQSCVLEMLPLRRCLAHLIYRCCARHQSSDSSPWATRTDGPRR